MGELVILHNQQSDDSNGSDGGEVYRPCFGSIEDEVVAILACTRFHACRIGAMIGLSETEAPHKIALGYILRGEGQHEATQWSYEGIPSSGRYFLFCSSLPYS
jgi:hypothetical protein